MRALLLEVPPVAVEALMPPAPPAAVMSGLMLGLMVVVGAMVVSGAMLTVGLMVEAVVRTPRCRQSRCRPGEALSIVLVGVKL